MRVSIKMASVKPEEYLDAASQWLQQRDAAYLAKEDVIVYYESLTGRKSDFRWIRMSLSAVARIIKVTLLPADDDGFKSHHILTACQELDRVYEFGITSTKKLRKGIFNFREESNMNTDEMVVKLLAEAIHQRGIYAFLHEHLDVILDNIFYKLSMKPHLKSLVDHIEKHFGEFGYEVKKGTKRVQYAGTKKAAIMLTGTRPSAMQDLSQNKDMLCDDIYAQLI